MMATWDLFLVFMLRHKFLKSKFNRPAKLSMPLDVRCKMEVVAS